LVFSPQRGDNPGDIDVLGLEDVVDLVEETVTRSDIDPVTVGINTPWGAARLVG
jgi:hypothetical protein